MHQNRNVRPTIPRFARTCYSFDDDQEDDSEYLEQRHRKFMYRRQIACFNKLYYATPEECETEDLVEWMKRRWGKAHVMKFVRVNGEMTLRVFRNEPMVSTGDSYDDISHTLNDCLRMEYVKYHLMTQRKMFKNDAAEYFDIPLSIYYDGTM